MRACRTHGTEENCIQDFGRKPERKRSLGRPKRRWDDDIRMNLREIGWEALDWMHLAQDRGGLL
jgi:hypothetical protein